MEKPINCENVMFGGGIRKLFKKSVLFVVGLLFGSSLYAVQAVMHVEIEGKGNVKGDKFEIAGQEILILNCDNKNRNKCLVAYEINLN